MKRVTKRLGALLVVSVLLASVLFGCAAQTKGTTDSATGTSAHNDQVTIGFPNIPEHFDPLQGYGTSGHDGGQLIFSTLVATDADMHIVPDLATDYTISDDALTYTFTLRDDARFTDGTPVTADDVVFTFQSFQDAATSVDLSMMAGITAADNRVVITLTEPRSTFLLTVAAAGIVPEHAYNADFGLNPVGSGPYKLAQLDPDQQWILEANEDYYGTVPTIKRAVFVKMTDEDTQLAAVKAGEVDITLTSATLANVNTVDGYHLQQEKTVDNMGVVMPTVPAQAQKNQYGAPVGNDITCDVNFRKALAYGIDRDAICTAALNGFATPAYSENDGMPWSNADSAIDYDLNYARELLDKAGWTDSDGDGIRDKDGIRAALPLLYFAGDSVRQAVCMALAQQARDNLGIEITPAGIAADDFTARMYAEPIILAWGSANPITSYYLYHSSHAGLDDWYNPENYTSDTVDGYLERAVAARTLDDASELFRQAQWDGQTGTSMRGDCPYVFLINKTHLYWVRDGLDIGRQQIHAHGDAWPLVNNLAEWSWAAN
ncbi:MAG: ABC transporter substrate-binding protein [Actinomycetes bacterium]|nr:ABC transporter substrate-binding protein [Actinomycetes bacterium]